MKLKQTPGGSRQEVSSPHLSLPHLPLLRIVLGGGRAVRLLWLLPVNSLHWSGFPGTVNLGASGFPLSVSQSHFSGLKSEPNRQPPRGRAGWLNSCWASCSHFLKMSSAGHFPDLVAGKGRVVFRIFWCQKKAGNKQGIRIRTGESGQATRVGKGTGESCAPKNDFVQKETFFG